MMCSVTTCRICGNEIRDVDDTVTVDDAVVHVPCVDAGSGPPSKRRIRRWAAFQTRQQMAIGPAQRDS